MEQLGKEIKINKAKIVEHERLSKNMDKQSKRCKVICPVAAVGILKVRLRKERTNPVGKKARFRKERANAAGQGAYQKLQKSRRIIRRRALQSR